MKSLIKACGAIFTMVFCLSNCGDVTPDKKCDPTTNDPCFNYLENENFADDNNINYVCHPTKLICVRACGSNIVTQTCLSSQCCVQESVNDLGYCIDDDDEDPTTPACN